MSGTNGGTLLGFLTGFLTSSVVAAIITLLFGIYRDRSAGRQKIMEHLTERRQELSKNRSDLLATIGFLEREAGGDASDPPFPPRKMRDLPGFLEPIGVFLEFNPDAFQRAYQVFAKEVELCANSQYIWLNDDLSPSEGEHYSTSPYWTSFRQFVANTRENLAEQRLPRVKRVVHRVARRVLYWLEG